MSNSAATSVELYQLYKKIETWKSGNDKLNKTDIKNKAQNVTIKNSKKKFTRSEFKTLVANFEKTFNYEDVSYDFKDLINMSKSELEAILTKMEQQKEPSDSLIPIKGISRVIQARLRDCNIYDIVSLIAQGRTTEKRKKLAQKINTDVKLVTTWVKQADLWRVEGMTTDMAYLLVMAGVRHVEDLSRVDKDKVLPILKGICFSQIDYELDEDVLDTVLENACEIVRYRITPNFKTFGVKFVEDLQEFVARKLEYSEENPDNFVDEGLIYEYIERYFNENKDSSLAFYYNCNIEVDDDEPKHLFRDLDESVEAQLELLNGRNIKKGLDFLDDIQYTLPLPRKITGTVLYKKQSTKENLTKYQEFGFAPFVGAKVEIDGIVSPSDDQSEANKKPSCTTDSTGRFIIVLPERYSIKETVTITISQGSNKQEFIKSASEIIASVSEQHILDMFYELKALGSEYDRVNALITSYETKLAESEEKNSVEGNRDCSLKDYPGTDNLWEATHEERELPTDDEEQLLTDKKEKPQEDEVEYDYASLRSKGGATFENYEEILDGKKSDDPSVPTNNGLRSELEALGKKYNELQDKILAMKECGSGRQTIEQAFEYFTNSVGDVTAVLEGQNFDDSRNEGFIVIEEIFKGERLDVEKALPKVKLMGNDDDAVHLSTDTAPSRIHSYSMLQRLVEPDITSGQRRPLTNPIDVMEFKKKMAENPNLYPQASSLGMGYVLNMHQAWVPDGFALGDLLYSLILAPGEEQRLVVRENKQSYTITDEAEATDATSENYAMDQEDDTSAAFNYAVDQLSKGNSSYNYSTKTSSFGASFGAGGGGGGFAAMLGLSGGYSKSSGKASSSARQSNSHNEVSSTAQNFQHSIKSASDKISQAKRVSMEMATSEQTDSVATKIIANHNHSHAMTVQYWEVMRRYKLETCIDSIDLVLFVPLRLIRFLPQAGGALTLGNVTPDSFDRTFFNKRYDTLIRYADAIRKALPYKYRTGLDLIRQYSSIPKWRLQDIDVAQQAYQLTFYGNFLSFDDLSVTMVLKNGKGTVAGSISEGYRKELVASDNYNYRTRRDLKTAIRDARNQTTGQKCTCTFILPANVTADDVSYIKIRHSYDDLDYTLYADFSSLSEAELKAYENMQDKLYDLAKDNNKSSGDRKKIAHYSSQLPEAFTTPNVTLTRRELRSLGTPSIWDVRLSTSVSGNDNSENTTTNITASLSDNSLDPTAIISVQTSYKTLRYNEFQKMEATLQHIVTNPMDYSKVVWASLSDDERVMMLEQYTIDMNFELLDNISGQKEKDVEDIIPLLNCVNVKNMLGFYGNCMILPFTFPQRLANKLNKTAADIQDMLYRYHTNNFRVPTTTVSLPTRGMIGEAVLGETNVSEEIDLTRFWNWQDSPIDKMDIDSSYLNGNDYLQGKSTKEISALNMQGATAATPVTVPDLVSALANKQTPTFNNITGLDQLKDVLNTATNSAASGRDNAINTSADVAKAALSAAMTSGQTQSGGNGGTTPTSDENDTVILTPDGNSSTFPTLDVDDTTTPSPSVSDTTTPTPSVSDTTTPTPSGNDTTTPTPDSDDVVGGDDIESDGRGSGDDDNSVPGTQNNNGIDYSRVPKLSTGEIFFDVLEAYQPNQTSCWVTCALILRHWLNEVSIDSINPQDVVKAIGNVLISNQDNFSSSNDRTLLDYYTKFTVRNMAEMTGTKVNKELGSLPYEDTYKIYIDALGFKNKPYIDVDGTSNISQDKIYNMLRLYGPCIVCYDSDENPRKRVGHVVILRGVKKGATENEAQYYIWDPDTGASVISGESLRKRINQDLGRQCSNSYSQQCEQRNPGFITAPNAKFLL